MGRKKIIPSSSFAVEVASVPGGEVVTKCVQCGICTASCTLAHVSYRYRPRRLIQKLLIGNRNDVLSSEQPWLCMTCHMCEERCQEGVSPAEVFHAVRLLAAKEGKAPGVFKKVAKAILDDGWLLRASYFDLIEDERRELGLPTELNWNHKFTGRVKDKYLGESDL